MTYVYSVNIISLITGTISKTLAKFSDIEICDK